MSGERPVQSGAGGRERCEGLMCAVESPWQRRDPPPSVSVSELSLPPRPCLSASPQPPFPSHAAAAAVPVILAIVCNLRAAASLQHIRDSCASGNPSPPRAPLTRPAGPPLAYPALLPVPPAPRALSSPPVPCPGGAPAAALLPLSPCLSSASSSPLPGRRLIRGRQGRAEGLQDGSRAGGRPDGVLQ